MSNFGSRKGGIFGSLLIVLVVTAIVVVVIGSNVARSIRVNTVHTANGDNVSIDTPAGHFSVRAHDKSGVAIVDIPKYPGARQRPNKGGGAVFEWTSSDGQVEKGLTVAGEETITDDPVQKVVDFYRDQLPAWVIAHDKTDGFRMELAEGGYKRIVTVRGRSDGTHIGVATIGAPAAN